jgi:hypothetical protein
LLRPPISIMGNIPILGTLDVSDCFPLCVNSANQKPD